MTRVLVTGAAGMLGRRLMSQVQAAGYVTRGSGRRARPEGLPADVEWAQADLGTGSSVPRDGVAEALAGVDAIIHAASNARQNPQAVDVEGTRRMLEAAKQAGVSQVVYISIVGIDRIPTDYYRAKLAAEEEVMQGGVPWTILRATQFHDLLDTYIGNYTRRPVAVMPVSYLYQTVDTGEAAAALVDCVRQGPRGRVPDMGGPEVLTLGQLARTWLHARGLHRRIVPKLETSARSVAFRRGYNTCPQYRQGKITWGQWLSQHA